MPLNPDAGLRDVAIAFDAALTTSLADRAALAARVLWLEQRQPRSAAAVAVPAVTTVVGTASVDVTLTWTTPWPDANYQAEAILDAGASLLGKTSAVVKSKSATGCVVTVTTSAVLTAGAATVRGISVTA